MADQSTARVRDCELSLWSPNMPLRDFVLTRGLSNMDNARKMSQYRTPISLMRYSNILLA